MTFKEKLVEQVKRASKINIEKEMNIIKSRMTEYAVDRNFIIYLINPRGTMAIGGGAKNFQTYVPTGCSPQRYQRMFIDALLELGFEEKDISLWKESFKGYDSYNIKVTW